jgi:hypothetical protein
VEIADSKVSAFRFEMQKPWNLQFPLDYIVDSGNHPSPGKFCPETPPRKSFILALEIGLAWPLSLLENRFTRFDGRRPQ